MATHTATFRQASAGASGRTWDRVGGLAALWFAAVVIFDNIARATMPGPGAGVADVTAWYRTHQTATTLAAGLFAVNLVALFTFVAVIWRRAGDDVNMGAVWARLGAAGAMLVASLFSIITVLDAAMSQSLTAGNDVFAVVWRIHWTVFTLNTAAIGTALLGLSMAARAARLIPRWTVFTSAFGAAVLVGGATPLVAAAAGNPVYQWALPGFAMWLLFLLVAAAGLLRGRD